jgi:hypothetical protein
VLGRDESWAGKLAGFGFLLPFFFYYHSLPNSTKQKLNSNRDLNPSTQKQCTGMNATVNSYISLIN